MGHKLRKYQLSPELASILKATGSMWCGISFFFNHLFGSVGKLSTPPPKKETDFQNSKQKGVNIMTVDKEGNNDIYCLYCLFSLNILRGRIF